MTEAKAYAAAHPVPEDASSAQLSHGAMAGLVLSLIGLVAQGIVTLSFLVGFFAG